MQPNLAGLRVVTRTYSPATTKSESPDLPVGAFVFLMIKNPNGDLPR